jgi:hypothetical protein
MIDKADRIAWFLIGFFCVLGLVFAYCGQAHGAAPTLADRLVTAQSALATRRDVPTDPRELAQSIVDVTGGNRQWSALLLTIAAHESSLSQRIADGNCNLKIGECDGGRAWGLYQVHRNARNADVWGSTDVDVQTQEAARMLRGAFYQCNPKSKGLPADWARGTINAYAGLRCDATWKGLDVRLATLARILKALG